MSYICIYGASDDLVEVDGNDSDEAGAYGEGSIVLLSDGSIVEVEYSPETPHGTYFAQWRVGRVEGTGSAPATLYPSLGPDARDTSSRPGHLQRCTPYSDVLVLEGDVRLVAFGARRHAMAGKIAVGDNGDLRTAPQLRAEAEGLLAKARALEALAMPIPLDLGARPSDAE